MTEDHDRKLLNHVRGELDRSTESLDELTVARLRAARRRAVAQQPARRRWVLAGGIAAATVTSAVVALLVFTPATTPLTTGLEPIDMLTEADPEFYRELEFYQWLAERERAG